MPQFVNTLINRFDGGISEDKREGWVGSGGNFTTNKFSLTKHFDVFTYPKKLVPYHKTTTISGKTYDIVKFLYAGDVLYGFGVQVGQTRGVVYSKASLVTGAWVVPSGGGDAVSVRVEDVFFYYKDYIYWWAGGNKLLRYDTGVADSWAIYQTIAYTTVAQPVLHPADDMAYFFEDNNVHRLDDTTFDSGTVTPVLVLPDDLKIVAACAYGNYLAIGCTSTQSYNKRNVVYLWDRDSSLATVTGIIDFGEGELKHLANLNNKLTAVMGFYLYSSTDGLSLDRPKVLIKQASGNFAVTLNKLDADDDVTITNDLPRTTYVADNKLYFPATIPLDSDTRLGIWVVDEYGRVTLDFTQDGATSYEGIFRVGNAWFIAHSDDGSVNTSDHAKGFSTTLSSIYESLIFSAGNPDVTKQLIGVAVTTEPLPTAGQIILKYRINEETSWTTILTETTNNSISHQAINIESSGAALPEFKEIQFQILSTGGAIVTGLEFKSEITNKGRIF